MTFPEEEAAERILSCVKRMLQNRQCFDGAAELWAMLLNSLLNLRLGCRLAEVLYCSVVCSLGTSCAQLAAPSADLLLGDSRDVAVGAGRGVMLSCEGNRELRFVELQLQLGEMQRTCVVSVGDTPAAAR